MRVERERGRERGENERERRRRRIVTQTKEQWRFHTPEPNWLTALSDV
jgi:hypothetical protein